MAERNNDKGFITWIFAIINLVLSGAVAVGFLTSAALTGEIWAIIMTIVWCALAVYVIWHSVMIILGKASNTWLYVIVSCFASLIGGILMLIAKILN